MICLNLDDRRGIVEPELFGCLIEEYGTLLDGIWVGENPDIPNDDGLRLDTIAAFREIGMRVIRFPGGTPADFYRWRDGIGPRSERPRTWNYFFGGESTNGFGTDEFLRLCETVGASASIKLNPISLPLQDALDWMQYCNYGGDSDLANARRANGHPEPYDVRHWIIGNETTDTWSPEDYASLVFRWTFFLRQVDPASKIVAEGSTEDWNERFLKRFSELSKEGGIASNDEVQIRGQGIRIQPGWKIHALGLKYPSEKVIQSAIESITRYFGEDSIELCVEEWQAQTEFTNGWPESWLRTMSIYEIVLQQGQSNLTYENDARMDGALILAESMHLYMRYARSVKSASFLYPTNAWTPLIKTRGPDFVRTPHYHAFRLLNLHERATVVGVEKEEKSDLDVMASLDEGSGTLTVSLVNRGERSVDASLRLGGEAQWQSASATVLTGSAADENTFDDPEKVIPRESDVSVTEGRLSVSCEPGSLTVVQGEI